MAVGLDDPTLFDKHNRQNQHNRRHHRERRRSESRPKRKPLDSFRSLNTSRLQSPRTERPSSRSRPDRPQSAPRARLGSRYENKLASSSPQPRQFIGAFKGKDKSKVRSISRTKSRCSSPPSDSFPEPGRPKSPSRSPPSDTVVSRGRSRSNKREILSRLKERNREAQKLCDRSKSLRATNSSKRGQLNGTKTSGQATAKCIDSDKDEIQTTSKELKDHHDVRQNQRSSRRARSRSRLRQLHGNNDEEAKGDTQNISKTTSQTCNERSDDSNIIATLTHSTHSCTSSSYTSCFNAAEDKAADKRDNYEQPPSPLYIPSPACAPLIIGSPDQSKTTKNKAQPQKATSNKVTDNVHYDRNCFFTPIHFDQDPVDDQLPDQEQHRQPQNQHLSTQQQPKQPQKKHQQLYQAKKQRQQQCLTQQSQQPQPRRRQQLQNEQDDPQPLMEQLTQEQELQSTQLQLYKSKPQKPQSTQLQLYKPKPQKPQQTPQNQQQQSQNQQQLQQQQPQEQKIHKQEDELTKPKQIPPTISITNTPGLPISAANKAKKRQAPTSKTKEQKDRMKTLHNQVKHVLSRLVKEQIIASQAWNEVAKEYHRRVEPFTAKFVPLLLDPEYLIGDLGNNNILSKHKENIRRRRSSSPCPGTDEFTPPKYDKYYLKGKSVLDVAAGTGAAALFAASKGASFVRATDFSSEMLGIIQKRIAEVPLASHFFGVDPFSMRGISGAFDDEPDNIVHYSYPRHPSYVVETSLADGLCLPSDWANRFDVVCSNFGVIFFPKVSQGILEMMKCAKPGTGKVCISGWGPNEETAAFRVFPDAMKRCGFDNKWFEIQAASRRNMIEHKIGFQEATEEIIVESSSEQDSFESYNSSARKRKSRRHRRSSTGEAAYGGTRSSFSDLAPSYLCPTKRIASSQPVLNSLLTEAGLVDVRVIGPITRDLWLESAEDYWSRFVLASPNLKRIVEKCLNEEESKRLKNAVFKLLLEELCCEEESGCDAKVKRKKGVVLSASAYIAFGTRKN